MTRINWWALLAELLAGIGLAVIAYLVMSLALIFGDGG